MRWAGHGYAEETYRKRITIKSNKGTQTDGPKDKLMTICKAFTPIWFSLVWFLCLMADQPLWVI